MSDIDTGFKKFQWAKFSPDRSEQFVIRTDSLEDLKESIKNIKELVPQKAAFPDDDSGPVATPPHKTQDEAPMCSIHKYPMIRSQYGGWYCGKKTDDGKWCKQKVRV